MIEHSNAIKQYKSPVDAQGNYRIYSVYQSGSQFIFEAWDCAETSNQGGVGSRKGYGEHASAAEAVAQFKEYIEAWEPDAKIDLS